MSSEPKVGDKIRLTKLDKTSSECGYMAGDEAVIVAVEAFTLDWRASIYEVKFTKLQNTECHDFHIVRNAKTPHDDVFFADEFEVVHDDV